MKRNPEENSLRIASDSNLSNYLEVGGTLSWSPREPQSDKIDSLLPAVNSSLSPPNTNKIIGPLSPRLQEKHYISSISLHENVIGG